MADSDTSLTNSSRPLTPLPPLRQLPEGPERGDEASIRAIPLDLSALTGLPGEIPPPSEVSGSQITTSDKLTALPSHLRTSSVGRSGLGPRTNNDSSSTDIQAAASTPEVRLTQTSNVRRAGVAPPISHSLSDSVAERANYQRGPTPYDSDRASLASTSPLPSDRPLPTASEPVLPSARAGTLSSFAARAHEAVHERLRYDTMHKHRPGHSHRASRLHRNSVGPPTRSPSLPGTPRRSSSPRGVLPLRSFLGRFSPGRGINREEPFVPINPFRLHAPLSLNPFARCFGKRPPLPDVELPVPGSQLELPRPCVCVPLLGSARFHDAHTLAFDTLPRQFYLHLQLRLPSLYFSRVARIFEDAAVSRPEIQRIIDAYESTGTPSVQNLTSRIVLPFPEDWVPPNVSPALARFKRSWENFVDSLVREWKTLNVLSALLLSAILTLFQIQDAESDPLTRTAALCSLVSALMSLSYGIMYIVRFGNMRSMYRASRWAEEAQKTETSIFWNVWVLLALPGIWLAWSVLAFIVAIMSFVWRSGARGESHAGLSQGQEYGPRVGITCQLLLGLVYFALVIRTFSNYGETGRRARVVRRFTDAQVELETRAAWAREAERERYNGRTLAREGEEEEARDRGRSRASDIMGQKEKPLTNELGLSGMERKQEAPAIGNGDIPANDSFSSLGI